MAYGHKVIRDYNKSCKVDNVEEVIPFQSPVGSIDLLPFMSISGMGDAPTTVALAEAAKKFQKDSPNVLNAILLISDGTDSCGQNPDEEAKILADRQQIVIYTIGISTNDNTDAELSAIAEQANGTYEKVPNFLSASQRATDELSGLIIKDLDNLVSRLSAPTPTVISTSATIVSSVTPVAIIPTRTLTMFAVPVEPTEAIMPIVTPENVSPVNSPSSNTVVILSIILASLLLVGGLWIRTQQSIRKVQNSDKFAKENLELLNKKVEILKTQNDQLKNHVQELGKETQKEEDIYRRIIPPINLPDKLSSSASDKKLEGFFQDVYKTYSTIGRGSYVSLEFIKKRLSGKYIRDQFDQLLIEARQKYPRNIWIDKDSQGETIVKIVL
jgi:hypothetical protein